MITNIFFLFRLYLLSGFVCLCFLFPYVCVSVYLCVFPFFSLVSLESLSLKSSNRVSGELKGVSRMFQGRFKGVSRKIKGCFKEFSGLFNDTLTLSGMGGGLLGPPCRKIVISPEPNLC